MNIHSEYVERVLRCDIQSSTRFLLEGQGALNKVIQTGLKNYSRTILIISSLLVSGMLFACGGDDSGTSSESTSKKSSEITIDGSSTVFPVTQAVAEEFRKEHPEVQIPVGISGTGGGFKRFTVGETDITNASRAIKPEEAEKAESNGIKFIELRVAWDGISVVTSKSNDFVDCLTTGELKLIWDAGSTVDNWNQVRSDFPDKKIRLYGPDTDSGTFDYFTDEINGEEDRSRSDYTASADDNTLVQGIAGDGGSIGYFGYAYYVENSDKLKLLAVDSGSGCISPDTTTINDGTYSPLSRSMFIYANTASIDRPEVKNFLEFFMNEGGTLAEEVGYVALSDADYQSNIELVNAK